MCMHDVSTCRLLQHLLIYSGQAFDSNGNCDKVQPDRSVVLQNIKISQFRITHILYSGCNRHQFKPSSRHLPCSRDLAILLFTDLEVIENSVVA